VEESTSDEVDSDPVLLSSVTTVDSLLGLWTAFLELYWTELTLLNGFSFLVFLEGRAVD